VCSMFTFGGSGRHKIGVGLTLVFRTTNRSSSAVPVTCTRTSSRTVTARSTGRISSPVSPRCTTRWLCGNSDVHSVAGNDNVYEMPDFHTELEAKCRMNW
jgi:hypothetical protein